MKVYFPYYKNTGTEREEILQQKMMGACGLSWRNQGWQPIFLNTRSYEDIEIFKILAVFYERHGFDGFSLKEFYAINVKWFSIKSYMDTHNLDKIFVCEHDIFNVNFTYEDFDKYVFEKTLPIYFEENRTSPMYVDYSNVCKFCKILYDYFTEKINLFYSNQHSDDFILRNYFKENFTLIKICGYSGSFYLEGQRNLIHFTSNSVESFIEGFI